jgi:hypothetical protein
MVSGRPVLTLSMRMRSRMNRRASSSRSEPAAGTRLEVMSFSLLSLVARHHCADADDRRQPAWCRVTRREAM